MSKRKIADIIPDGVFMVSLGCPKNLVDSEVMAGILATSGYFLCMDERDAGIYLVNTCAFLPAAREEAEAAVRDAIRWKKKHPGRRIVIAGCLPEKDRDHAVRSKYPEVDLWLRVDAIPRLGELLNAADGRSPETGGEPAFLYDHTMPRMLLTMPHVAYLKIADGCDNRCSYCSIPGIRGALRSRPSASVIAEAKQLLDSGVRELVIIAQDITAYGLDRPESGDRIDLLVRQLDALPGDFRIRLLYAHPAHLTSAFMTAMAESPKVARYLDLPLQHISERILRAMGRHVSAAEVKARLDELRQKVPGIVIRTTFIAGFPGESEEEFAELKAFMAEQRFHRCGVFAFSPEPDTRAATLADRIPAAVAEARAAELMKMQQQIMLERQRERIGTRDRVLIDRVEGREAFGRGVADAPDIDNETVISNASRLKVGEFHDIVIKNADSYCLYGEPDRPADRKTRH